jgi:hypothetical protein
MGRRRGQKRKTGGGGGGGRVHARARAHLGHVQAQAVHRQPRRRQQRVIPVEDDEGFWKKEKGRGAVAPLRARGSRRGARARARAPPPAPPLTLRPQRVRLALARVAAVDFADDGRRFFRHGLKGDGLGLGGRRGARAAAGRARARAPVVAARRAAA